jgi:opacity protein-like surface antigen
MKKLIYSVTVAMGGVSSVVAYPTSSNMTGFYLGLHGGQEFTKTKLQSNSKIQFYNQHGGEFADFSIPSKKGSKSKKGLLGGIHLGYQYDLNNYLIGIELSSTHFKNKTEKTLTGPGAAAPNGNPAVMLNHLKVKIAHKHNYGSALRLGYKVRPQWVVGIKIGYVHDRYDFQYTNYYNEINTDGDIETRSFKKKIKYNSFVPGVYIEKFIDKHIIIGAEYSYTMHKKKTFSQPIKDKILGGAPGREVGVKTSDNISVKSRTHDFKLRLGYKF